MASKGAPVQKKFFLDTSIVRHFLHGSTPYKKYLKSEIPEGLRYINAYIGMEYRRGFLITLISFYRELDNPYYTTFQDVVNDWGNRFNQREVRTILNLVANLALIHGIPPSGATSKARLRQTVGDFIVSAAIEFDCTFTDCGNNPSKCPRGTIPLQLKQNQDIDSVISAFGSAFTDERSCRSKCGIAKHSATPKSTALAIAARQVPKTLRIAEGLDALNSDAATFTCRDCAAAGDAFIALECPTTMELTTIDSSFDTLAPVAAKAHRKLLTPLQLRPKTP